ncbi:hypothetical protein L596_021909 [Steinernema carpocapsae]|uniref:Serine/threonine-protein phosphatase n=1 Tax=Steinernema carpocapsae TaxID=34508 RepID=A0A4U5MK84_STECR|nr:hypothetical protein L596_021909 [Steinernema carpocapsae]
MSSLAPGGTDSKASQKAPEGAQQKDSSPGKNADEDPLEEFDAEDSCEEVRSQKAPNTKTCSGEQALPDPELSVESLSSEEDEPEAVPNDEIVQIPLVNALLYRLLTAGIPPADAPRKKRLQAVVDVNLKAEELLRLTELATESLKKQKPLIRIENKSLPLLICGDIHGQFRDLRAMFGRLGSPFNQSYLFLGDYVDRGLQGIETAAFLLCLQIKFPTKVFLLRGNHEDRGTTMSYGFFDECVNRFSTDSSSGVGERVYEAFLHAFKWLPLAALVDNVILCMHGGLSPELTTIDDLEKIPRPCMIPSYGLLCDLLWSDPSPDDSRNEWSMSQRGIGYNYGTKVVEEFCKRNSIDLIVRGHQMLDNGYKFMKGGHVLTIFTAPNYTNLKNDGVILRVSKSHTCHFIFLRVQRNKKKKDKEAEKFVDEDTKIL